jgi:hypothetical protein
MNGKGLSQINRQGDRKCQKNNPGSHGHDDLDTDRQVLWKGKREERSRLFGWEPEGVFMGKVGVIYLAIESDNHDLHEPLSNGRPEAVIGLGPHGNTSVLISIDPNRVYCPRV